MQLVDPACSQSSGGATAAAPAGGLVRVVAAAPGRTRTQRRSVLLALQRRQLQPAQVSVCVAYVSVSVQCPVGN